MSTKAKKKMSEKELQATLAGQIRDAIAYTHDELGPERAKATDYFLAHPFGNEEEGRSQFVMSEVRDTVLGTLPGLLRVIHGPEHVVEVSPRNPSQIAMAEQVTDYVRFVYEEDNAGLLKTYAVAMDGLVRKLGIYKWGVDESASVKNMSGHATQSQIEQLLQDDGFKLGRVTQTNEAEVRAAKALVGADGQPLGQPVEPEFDIEFTYTENEKKIWIDAVPPNEFIYNREAREISKAQLVGHRMRKTASDLLALGVKQTDIDAYGGDETDILEDQESQARNTSMNATVMPDETTDPATQKHLYIEAYVLVDFDGDDTAELRKVCTLGPGFHVVHNKPVSSRPFSIFTPIIEPHTLTGQSYADLTMDIQLLKSSMVRAVQDSAAASIFPRMGYVEGHVSVADIMNTAIGGPIRMQQQGDVTAITVPFLGAEMLPLIQYIDDVKENRTGQSKGAVGLDADALQSTEKAAAGAVISATQSREEVLARIFAEQALKPMIRGLLELIAEIQPKKRMIKMRGQYVEIDPATWDLNLDVSVNVMLGSAMKEQKIAALQAFAGEQKEVMAALGITNPVAGIDKLVNTYRKAAKLLGFADVDNYFGELPPNFQPPAPQPDAQTIKVQADAQLNSEKLKLEQAKIQLAGQESAQQHELDVQKLQLEIEKMRQDGQLRLAELNAKHDIASATDSREREKTATEQALAITNMELVHGTKVAELSVNAKVKGAEIEAGNVQKAAEIAADTHKTVVKEGLEHERSMVELEAAKADSSEASPSDGSSAKTGAPKTEINIHVPTPKTGR